MGLVLAHLPVRHVVDGCTDSATPMTRALVCFAKCWACNFGQCPGGPHDWADQDDIDGALAANQKSPAGQPCGCPCINEPPRVEFEFDGPDLDGEGIQSPCPTCGELGACGYDSEGRVLIHLIPVDDDE